LTCRGDREALTHLRSLVVRGDHPELVTALRHESWPVDSLQLIGDGLLAAVRGSADGSADLARQCVNALRERRWHGDLELAEALEAALGEGPTSMLRPLPVDLEELALILEGDPVYGGGRIDLRTGQAWPQSAIEYAEEVGEIDEDDDDPDRWLWVECEGSTTATRTWCGSSRISTTLTSLTSSAAQSPAAAPSAGSRTGCQNVRS
jgi:hypothetical protein